MKDRWFVTINYKNLPTNCFTVEEIEDIQKIVESGPDWGEIENIEIKYNF